MQNPTCGDSVTERWVFQCFKSLNRARIGPKEDTVAEKTYTGPNPEDEFFGGKKLSLEIFIGAAALVVAVLAMVVGIVVWSRTTSLGESLAVTTDNLAKESSSNVSFEKDVLKNFGLFQVRLAADATRLTILDGKVEKLESKSVVADLAKELREGKASKVSLEILRNEVLDKADAKTVKRLARRMGKFDTRISNIVELNKLVEVAPAAPPEVRKATLPASQAIPAERARLEASVPPTGPGGQKEAPAAPIKSPVQH